MSVQLPSLRRRSPFPCDHAQPTPPPPAHPRDRDACVDACHGRSDPQQMSTGNSSTVHNQVLRICKTSPAFQFSETMSTLPSLFTPAILVRVPSLMNLSKLAAPFLL